MHSVYRGHRLGVLFLEPAMKSCDGRRHEQEGRQYKSDLDYEKSLSIPGAGGRFTVKALTMGPTEYQILLYGHAWVIEPNALLTRGTEPHLFHGIAEAGGRYRTSGHLEQCLACS